MPTEIVTHLLDAVRQPDLSKPVAGDTTPIRSPNASLPDKPVEASKVAPLPSILDLDDPAKIEGTSPRS